MFLDLLVRCVTQLTTLNLNRATVIFIVLKVKLPVHKPIGIDVPVHKPIGIAVPCVVNECPFIGTLFIH